MREACDRLCVLTDGGEEGRLVCLGLGDVCSFWRGRARTKRSAIAASSAWEFSVLVCSLALSPMGVSGREVGDSTYCRGIPEDHRRSSSRSLLSPLLPQSAMSRWQRWRKGIASPGAIRRTTGMELYERG